MRKIFFAYLIISAVIGGALSYLIFKSNTPEEAEVIMPPAVSDTDNNSGIYQIGRLNGYHYIKPILFAEQKFESKKYATTKSDINNKLDAYKKAGDISAGSVYLMDFNHGEWIACNGEEEYDPGSLLKVPTLITYLRMDETAPGVLKKDYFFGKPNDYVPVQTFSSQAILPGHKYTVRQLLYYMIAYSDNNATNLLLEHMDDAAYKKTYTDLGLTAPDKSSKRYPITVKEYSSFMEALYNGSYLSIPNSEYATSLLGKSNFKDGMLSGLPADTKVAHKFGEWTDSQTHQLHESGIIYYNNSPYLVTVMTKGKDVKKLPGVIGGVTKLVYDDMARFN